MGASAIIVCIAASMLLAHAVPNVTFSSLFIGESVVLQHENARVWGTADAGATVALFLNGKSAGSALADSTGNWSATLPSQVPAWDVELQARAGSAVATTHVRFGFVLLCSGQSNMQLQLAQLDNGTAEADAAGAFTGRVSLLTLQAPQHTLPSWNGTASAPQWNGVSPGSNGTVFPFSGLCWLTGKLLYEALEAPVGLIVGAVGGTPIEAWLPPGVLGKQCPVDEPPCDPGAPDSSLFTRYIAPFAPLAIGGVLWDQAERDVRCMSPATNRTAQYACMESALVQTWRGAFESPRSAFVAVQLPGYLGDCWGEEGCPPLHASASLTPPPVRASASSEHGGDYYNCVPGVFNMRVAQAAGVAALANATYVPTCVVRRRGVVPARAPPLSCKRRYDLSCPFGVDTPACPIGSVHNLNKTVVARRVAQALLTQIAPAAYPPLSAAPPVATAATAQPAPGGGWNVTVSFDAPALALLDTQHCVACCAGARGPGGGGDFDASADGGATWVNGTALTVSGAGAGSVSFLLPQAGMPVRPATVRYTANQGFPQCAVTGLANGLPAAPFVLEVTP